MFAAFWYYGLSISLRRFYDMNGNKKQSILWSILISFPFLGFGIPFIFLAFQKGTQGKNDYGEPDTGKFLDSAFKLKAIK